MFQAGELDAMRAEYLTSLLRTCTISTPGAASVDEYGNTTYTPTTQTSVPCSFMAATGNERMVGGAIASVGQFILRFKWDATVSAPATVVVNSTATLPARTFQLVAPLDQANPVGKRWVATEG